MTSPLRPAPGPRRPARLALVLVLVLVGCRTPLLPGARQPERRAYREALALRQTDPLEAERRLQAFLETWPRSPLADDAGVALAQLQLGRGDQDGALQTLHAIVSEHPRANRTDEARFLLARLQQARGHPDAGYRTASAILLSRLSEEERRIVRRLLADLAGESGDRVAQLRWLAALHAAAPDADTRVALDAEIDQLVESLEEPELLVAAEQLGERWPAARLHLRLAELRVAQRDLYEAQQELAVARALPLGDLDRSRLEALERRLGLREPEPAPPLPPRLDELGGIVLPDPARAQGVLGVVVPLSGPFAAFGEEALRGVLLATRIFDATAPPGANGGIRVRVGDSRSSAAGAERAVHELARDPEVSAIVGPLALAEAEGAARAAALEQVPLLALARRETEAGANPYEFRLGLSPEDEIRLLADFAVWRLGAERFAILYPRDAYGQALRALFWDAVEERGQQVVAVAAYDPSATDYSDAIRRLVGYVFLSPAEQQGIAERDRLLDRAKRLTREAGRELREKAVALTTPDGRPLPPIVDFDVLFVPDSYDNVVLIAPQLAFHGVEGVQLLGTNGWNHPDLVRVGQQHVEGAVFTSSYHPAYPHPLVEGFGQRFQATFGTPPQAFAAQGYDAANLVLGRWIEGARSRESLREGLLGLRDQPGVSGVLSIGSDGNAVRRPLLLSIEQGRTVPVD